MEKYFIALQCLSADSLQPVEPSYSHFPFPAHLLPHFPSPYGPPCFSPPAARLDPIGHSQPISWDRDPLSSAMPTMPSSARHHAIHAGYLHRRPACRPHARTVTHQDSTPAPRLLSPTAARVRSTNARENFTPNRNRGDLPIQANQGS
jgi:hypothetical protein